MRVKTKSGIEIGILHQRKEKLDADAIKIQQALLGDDNFIKQVIVDIIIIACTLVLIIGVTMFT